LAACRNFSTPTIRHAIVSVIVGVVSLEVSLLQKGKQLKGYQNHCPNFPIIFNKAKNMDFP
jgi:hypothetical protein